MNKRWRNAGLYALLAIVVIALGTTFFDQQPQAQQTAKYSEFIRAVESGKVEGTVAISSDRTEATYTNPDGSGKVVVNLPNDPQLIDILTENNLDVRVQPQTDDGFWFRALSSLFFPILLLVGLFFLLRRAQSAPVAKR